MTKEIFCTYQQCKRLKRLGFNIPCWCYYHYAFSGRVFLSRATQFGDFNSGVHLSAPTQDVAHTWLIENKNLFITVDPKKKDNGETGFTFSIFQLDNIYPIGGAYEIYDKHWMAMSAALDYAIEYTLMQGWKK